MEFYVIAITYKQFNMNKSFGRNDISNSGQPQLPHMPYIGSQIYDKLQMIMP